RDQDNLVRLAAALRELGARVFTESVPEGLSFDCSPEALSRGETWNLVTDAGRIDVAFVPSGTEGYADLMEGAVRFEVFGSELWVAGLADIIRSKKAAARPKDRHDVVILEEILCRYGSSP